MQERLCCPGWLHYGEPLLSPMCHLRSLPVSPNPLPAWTSDGFLPPLFACFAVFPWHFGMRFPHGLTYYYYTPGKLFSGYTMYFFCLSFCTSFWLSFFCILPQRKIRGKSFVCFLCGSFITVVFLQQITAVRSDNGDLSAWCLRIVLFLDRLPKKDKIVKNSKTNSKW